MILSSKRALAQVVESEILYLILSVDCIIDHDGPSYNKPIYHRHLAQVPYPTLSAFCSESLTCSMGMAIFMKNR
jgi:hypothetical protein